MGTEVQQQRKGAPPAIAWSQGIGRLFTQGGDSILTPDSPRQDHRTATPLRAKGLGFGVKTLAPPEL